MQQAGNTLQQAQQQLAQAGQRGERQTAQGPQFQQGSGASAPGGAQGMSGGDQYGASGMPAGGGGGKGSKPGGGMPGNPDGSGSEAGHGTTNQRQGGGQMGWNTAKNRQSKEHPGMRAQFEQIYAPERVASNRLDTQVRGRMGQGRRPSDYQAMRGAPDPSAASRPYYEVYSQYRHAAEDALGKEDVPATYRKQVRDYFESLRPSQ